MQHGLTYLERILARVKYDHGCWIYTGKRNAKGYGKLGTKARSESQLTHRAVYESIRGPLAPGCELDHRCRMRACCNPDHLDAVTHVENMNRARRPQCRRGHEMTPGNIVMTGRANRSGPSCRTCINERRAS